MPTTRPRHLVTETDDLAAALDAAAARWPGLSRPQLLVKLAVTNAEPLVAQERMARRLAAHRRLSGSLTAPQDCLTTLDQLREDWPA